MLIHLSLWMDRIEELPFFQPAYQNCWKSNTGNALVAINLDRRAHTHMYVCMYIKNASLLNSDLIIFQFFPPK